MGTAIRSAPVTPLGGGYAADNSGYLLDPQTREKFGWKFFNYTWTGATPGEHTLVSRVTQADGLVQPTEQELADKKTFLEDNSQHPRKVMIG